MVPIYSIVSFASYLFWVSHRSYETLKKIQLIGFTQNQSTPLLLLRDCYEATVLTSFFYLLLMYLSPNPVEQKDIFRKVRTYSHTVIALTKHRNHHRLDSVKRTIGMPSDGENLLRNGCSR